MSNVIVRINNNVVSFRDVQPQIINGRVMIPLRGVFEELGCFVGWDGANQRVIIENAKFRLTYTIGSLTSSRLDKSTKQSSQMQRLDVAPQIIDGRTLIALRHPIEALGFSVDWQASNSTALITKNSTANDLNAKDYIQITVWHFFNVQHRFSKEQTAGIMGNIFQESSWNPLRRRSSSQYWGLFQLSSNLANELHNLYRNSGLDMARYGYNVSTFHGIGAEANIPRGDLTTILSIQLSFARNERPTARDWETPLRNASSYMEAAEVFLVDFLGAITPHGDTNEDNRIIYYDMSNHRLNGRRFQEARQRREHAETYFNQFDS